MSDDGELNLSGVYMPKFFSQPLTLSSKQERERKNVRYIPPAPRPHHVRSAPSQPRTRLIHSRNNDSSRELDASFNLLMQQNGSQNGNIVTFFRQYFEIQSRLGFGSFGDVYRCKSNLDGKDYAVKKSRRTYSGENDRARQLREVQRVTVIPAHKHLVGLEQAWEEQGHLYQQMELCSKSLNQFIEDGNQLDKTEVWNVLIDMLLALSHLHKHHLVHLDVKTDNILLSLDEPTVYKLGDFGIVVSLDAKRDVNEYTEGDSRYLAPEVMQGTVSTKADVFSLGMTILEISCHVDLPTGGELWHKLRQGGPLPLSPEAMSSLPKELEEVVTLMLTPDPTLRPEIDTLLKLPQVIKHSRRRRWSMFYSYLEKKLSSLKRVWNAIVCFIASLFVIGGGRKVRVLENEGTSTPEPIAASSPMPEILLNDNSFSDDDDLKHAKTSTPAFASTPISITKSKAKTVRGSRQVGSVNLRKTME